MIRRLYFHNFRTLENFEISLSEFPSALLIGTNGAGKSTVSFALEILQKIARGASRVGRVGGDGGEEPLLTPEDFSHGRTDVPMRFEIEAAIRGINYTYSIAFELPPKWKELRVLDEKLTAGGEVVFARDRAIVTRPGTQLGQLVEFGVDWHMFALTVIQERAPDGPLEIFRNWMARVLILRPIPPLIKGNSSGTVKWPNDQVTNFGEWFAGMVSEKYPAYGTIEKFLRQVMPDFAGLSNPEVSPDVRRLSVQFATDQKTTDVPFAALSDGEKCFLIWATVIAAHRHFGPLCCFWDEPDNYLSLQEIAHFTTDLRKVLGDGGQFIATSHNPEAIQSFSDENTLVLYRKSHLEPTQVRSLAEIGYQGDLISTLVRGDLEP